MMGNRHFQETSGEDLLTSELICADKGLIMVQGKAICVDYLQISMQLDSKINVIYLRPISIINRSGNDFQEGKPQLKTKKM